MAQYHYTGPVERAFSRMFPHVYARCKLGWWPAHVTHVDTLDDLSVACLVCVDRTVIVQNMHVIVVNAGYVLPLPEGDPRVMFLGRPTQWVLLTQQASAA